MASTAAYSECRSGVFTTLGSRFIEECAESFAMGLQEITRIDCSLYLVCAPSDYVAER